MARTKTRSKNSSSGATRSPSRITAVSRGARAWVAGVMPQVWTGDEREPLEVLGDTRSLAAEDPQAEHEHRDNDRGRDEQTHRSADRLPHRAGTGVDDRMPHL